MLHSLEVIINLMFYHFEEGFTFPPNYPIVYFKQGNLTTFAFKNDLTYLRLDNTWHYFCHSSISSLPLFKNGNIFYSSKSPILSLSSASLSIFCLWLLDTISVSISAFLRGSGLMQLSLSTLHDSEILFYSCPLCPSKNVYFFATVTTNYD